MLVQLIAENLRLFPNSTPDLLLHFPEAGYTLVESSNLGPRPEKPIELYEFEGCVSDRRLSLAASASLLFPYQRFAVYGNVAFLSYS